MRAIEWLLRGIGWLVRSLIVALARILSPLIGRVRWSAPGWMRAVRRKPRAATGTAIVIIILVVAGWFTWNWYSHRPVPPHLTFTVSGPVVTKYAVKDGEAPQVHGLWVTFSRSAAPIEKVDEVIKQGISMDPAVVGTWKWEDDHSLVFMPAHDWPVGQHYRATFVPRQLLAPQVRIVKDHFEFSVAPFRATLGDGAFHQDPTDARNKQVIQEIDFNYPVDAAALEKRVHLAVARPDGEPGKSLPFTITYGKHKLRAYIHSSRLPLPHDSGQVLVKVDAGVTSSLGGNGSADDLTGAVGVPGLYSLRVSTIRPTVAEDENQQPKQVLVLDFSAPVRGTDVAAHVHAWVLPTHRRGQRSTRPAYWGVDKVSAGVLADATPLPLTLTPTQRAWQGLQSFSFHVAPDRMIYVRVGKGLKSFGGYIMGQPAAYTMRVPDYPRTLAFVGAGSLLSLSGSKRIGIVARNLPGFKLVIGRVLPHQLQHLASLNQGSYSHPQLPYAFSRNQIVDRQVITRPLPSTDPAEADYASIDLGKYFASGQRGVFWLHLSGYDPARAARDTANDARNCNVAKSYLAKPVSAASSPAPAASVSGLGVSGCRPGTSSAGAMPGAPTDSRLIVLTDLGQIVKKAVNGSQDVFVQSIHDGRPVAGATVAVVAVDGKTLLSRTTRADGMVTFPSLEGFSNDDEPAMYLVTKGKDSSFLPVSASDRDLDYSRFAAGGATNAVNPGQLSAYLFSDRGLYRPGETMHIGSIVRAADWKLDVAGIPLQADLVDPRGNTVHSFHLTLDRTGFNELTWAFPQTAATGTWSVNLYVPRNGQSRLRIGHVTVVVKQFLPAQMKVKASLSSSVVQGWVKPDGLKGMVDAENLFGTPAADRRVTSSITLQPAYPEFADWPDWRFHDIRAATRGYKQQLPDARTDAQGQARIDLDLSKFADATYRLSFLARVYQSGSGRGVAALASAMVSNDDWLVGYKSADDLDYVTRGTARSVQLVAINPQAKSIALSALTAQLVDHKYVSVLTKLPSGAYKYVSRPKDIPVSNHALTIPAGGTSVQLDTSKPGNFGLIIEDKNGKELNRIDYSVAGAGNVSRSLTHNAELQLTLDKKVYKPGDTIHVSIRAPYTGSGLITIERDKVYAHAWIHTTTTSSVQSITVPKGFTGNGYVNIEFVRDPTSNAIFMSPLSYALAPFRMSRGEHTDALTVTTPGLVKPGHTITFHVHTAHPAKVVVFAVNQGILAVARYRFNNPLDSFFAKHRLGVSTSQILDLILPEFEKLIGATSTPGGDANAAISRQLNPFTRKLKAPVAYWSGITQVDDNKDFSYTLPDDFNGTLRVMAMAVSPHRVGVWQGTTTVRGDFVLSPSAPTTLAPGDEAVVSVGVANNLTDIGKEKVPVKLTLTTSKGLKVIGSATQVVELGSMHEGKVTFRVQAQGVPGSADLNLTARYGNHEVKLGTTTSVRPDVAYRVSIDTYQVDDGDSFDYKGLRNMFVPFAQRSAVFSSSPVVLARGLTSYLINYPNLCTEQLVSSAMPRLIVPDWPAAQAFIPALKPAFGHKAISNAQALDHLLTTIETRQNSEGGFGLWSATPTSLPFISAYTMNFLLEAQRRGVNVPSGVIAAGNHYLQQLAADDSLATLSGLRDRAYAIFLLTSQGNVTTNAIAAVQKRLDALYPKTWHREVAAAWLAASYKLLKQDDVADELITGPVKVLERGKPDDDSFDFANYYGPAIRDASVLYVLSRVFPKRAAELSGNAIENIAWPLEHQHYNTLSAGMTLLALDSYARANAKGLDKLHIQSLPVAGNSNEIGQIVGNLVQASSFPTSATGLRFVNGSDVPAWSVVTQSGYDRQAPTKAVKRGLEVARDFTDMDGKPLKQVTLGQKIEVHLKIRATGKRDIDHVAIQALLPGGFNVVLRTPPTAGAASSSNANAGWTSPIGSPDSTWQPTFAEVREDRILIYGVATTSIQEFTYAIRATSVGTFHVPPLYASAMYQPDVSAQAPGGATLTVVSPKP